MKKVWKIILPIILIVGSLGTYGGLYYNAVNQIDVSIDEVEITSFSPLTLFPPSLSVDIDLKLTGEISNPTFMNIKVQAVYFDVSIEDNFIGTGEVAPFIASDIPFPLDITLDLNNIQGDACTELSQHLLLGQTKTIQIDITRVVVMGIAIDLDQRISQEITHDIL